jgi:putative aldouronate transport system permease protein
MAESSPVAGISINLSQLPSETIRFALCIIAAGPMLIIFPFFQKYFAKGLTVGAVKE